MFGEAFKGYAWSRECFFDEPLNNYRITDNLNICFILCILLGDYFVEFAYLYMTFNGNIYIFEIDYLILYV